MTFDVNSAFSSQGVPGQSHGVGLGGSRWVPVFDIFFVKFLQTAQFLGSPPLWGSTPDWVGEGNPPSTREGIDLRVRFWRTTSSGTR